MVWREESIFLGEIYSHSIIPSHNTIKPHSLDEFQFIKYFEYFYILKDPMNYKLKQSY